MIERTCIGSINAVLRYRMIRGYRVGIMSSNIIMIELEDICIQKGFEQCTHLIEEVKTIYRLIESFIRQYGIDRFCMDVLPFYMALGNKSLHVVLPFCVTKDMFPLVYMFIHSAYLQGIIKHIDISHVISAFQQRAVTLRISEKEGRFPKPILMARLHKDMRLEGVVAYYNILKPLLEETGAKLELICMETERPCS